MFVSCAITTFNSHKTILQVLDVVAPLVEEVIVVDDASIDRTTTLVEEYKQTHSWLANKITIVNKEKNHGLSHSRNLGLRQAKYSSVLLMDADIVMTRAWMLAAQERLVGKVAIVGGKTVVPITNLITWYMAILREYRNRKKNVSYIGGGAGLYNREVVLGLGGFNEDMRSAEDIDLAARVQKAGHKILRIDEPTIHLGEPLSLGRLLARQWKYRMYANRSFLNLVVAIVLLTPFGLLSFVPLLTTVKSKREYHKTLYIGALPFLNYLFLAVSYVGRFLPK